MTTEENQPFKKEIKKNKHVHLGSPGEEAAFKAQMVRAVQHIFQIKVLNVRQAHRWF